MDKKIILSALQLHYNLPKDLDFAEFLGIKQSTLSNWKSRNSIDYEKIITKCEDINANWLFNGKGSMLRLKTGSDNLLLHDNYKELAESRLETIVLLKEKIDFLMDTIQHLKEYK